MMARHCRHDEFIPVQNWYKVRRKPVRGKLEPMTKVRLLAAILVLAAFPLLAVPGAAQVSEVSQLYQANLLSLVRAAATTIPGPLPARINYLKFAESHRPLADIIDGGGQGDFVSARTAFQVVYPAGSVMIDAGMDRTVHRFFGFGREEPYWPERNAAVQQALREASLIVVTHEHGDHAAGVIRTAFRGEIAPKTVLTRGQVATLTTAPQMPEIRLTPEAARDYIILDYEAYLPLAPGMVLIKAPGHTSGHQMVYVRLASGREYLFIGDVAWTLANVTKLKLRPENTMRRIGEDGTALMVELRWIKRLIDEERVTVIPSHDDVLLRNLAAAGLIGEELMLRER
jgi:glyoxylase-like metal-dependent hydrolase (beta-lactamase superfamily II)